MAGPDFERRPWGEYVKFIDNEPCTVKILTVDEGEVLSYQRHKLREEHWVVIDGEGFAILNDEKITLKQGDELKIAKGDKHRLGATTPLRVLEIATGFFDEEDNERLEDVYGR